MKVRVASELFEYTGDRPEVEARGATLGAVLADLDRRHPGLRFRVVDEQDRVRQHMNVFVAGRPTRDLGETELVGDAIDRGAVTTNADWLAAPLGDGYAIVARRGVESAAFQQFAEGLSAAVAAVDARQQGGTRIRRLETIANGGDG